MGVTAFFSPFNRICNGNEATSEDCTERSATCPRSTVVRNSIAISCGGRNTSEVNWKFTNELLAKIVIQYNYAYFFLWCRSLLLESMMKLYGCRVLVPVTVRGGWNCTLQEVDFGEQLVTETLVVKKLQLFVDSQDAEHKEQLEHQFKGKSKCTVVMGVFFMVIDHMYDQYSQQAALFCSSRPAVLKFCLTKLRYYSCNTQVLLLPKMRQCKLFGQISTFAQLWSYSEASQWRSHFPPF